MEAAYTVNAINEWTVVEFRKASLMDALELEQISTSLQKLVDDEDKRRVIIDFEKVQYLSSQALGLIISLHKRVAALKGKLVLCSINDKLKQLLAIVRLDKVLVIKPSQREAVKTMP